MDKLTNTLNLLSESLSEATHYAQQVNLILKEKQTEQKQVANVKEENKKKNPPEEKEPFSELRNNG